MTKPPGNGRDPRRGSPSSGSRAPGGGRAPSAAPRGAGPRRPPRAVFWLRRVVALGLVALAVVVGVLVVKAVVPAVSSALGGGDEPVVAGTTDATASTTPSPTGGPAADCTPADVATSVVPTTPIVVWGKGVTFTVQVRNVGTASCVVDGSDAARAVVVSKGSTKVWSSADCAATTQRLLLLGPGDVDTQKVTWDRTRSATRCATTAATKAAVTAGGYTVTSRLLGVTSDPAPVTLAAKPDPTPTTTPTGSPTTAGGGTPTSGATTPSGGRTPSGTTTAPTTKATTEATEPATTTKRSGDADSTSAARD
ncbi:hypothetical protein [Luteimicrobium sp. DT211]|uniref:hypothetical protein n=1 Tax=Luteimicrobium sp. DT211 TaxID=3393412 RepID=UPI003CEC8FD0